MTSRSIEHIRHPLRVRRLQVRRVRQPAPRYQLITLGGDGLADFRSPSPTDHVGVIPPVHGEVILPEVSGERLMWPAGDRPPMREYTVRRFDPEAREIDVRILVHGGGPVADWAVRAVAGDEVGVVGPRVSEVMPDGFANYLLVGDLTAVPAIARWLSELPEGATAQVLIAARSEEDVVELKCAQPISVLWSTEGGLPEADRLPSMLGALAPYSPDTFAWAAGEALAMRGVRRALLAKPELTGETVKITGYWRRARADYDYEAPLEAD
jgi:NADPH-dependent ferric siderophore reductase